MLLLLGTTPAAAFVPGAAHAIRGDAEATGELLRLGGYGWGAFFTSALTMGFSGAADVVTIVSVPIAVVSATAILSLSLADVVGAVGGDDAAPVTPALPAESRASLSYRAAFDPILVDERFVRAAAELRRPDYELGARHEGGLEHDFSETAVRGAWRVGVAWAELGLARGHSEMDRYTILRVEPRVRARFDLRRLGPTLAWLEHETWVGYFFERLRFDLADAGAVDRTSGVTAGARLRGTMASWAGAEVGYEHDRTGIGGGVASGFLGSFSVLLRLLPLEGGPWVFAEAASGSPSIYTMGSEWRW